jgi:hypothetical protein
MLTVHLVGAVEPGGSDPQIPHEQRAACAQDFPRLLIGQYRP